MAATALLKKSPYMKEWMVQNDPPKEQYLEKKIQAINPPKNQRKQLFQNSLLQGKMSKIATLKKYYT